MRLFIWFGGCLLAFFVFLVFLGISLLICRFLFRPWSYRRWGYGHRDEALEVLKMRYVKGEITKEQYLEMRKDLEAS